MPAERPVMLCEPFAATLLRPLPLTATEDALTLDHVMVVEPGAVVAVGVALIEADTAAGAATVTVWLIVPEVAPTESTAFAVKVIVVGPVSDVVLPESASVPLPPPPNANATPAFQTLTWVRLPSTSWPCAEIV